MAVTGPLFGQTGCDISVIGKFSNPIRYICYLIPAVTGLVLALTFLVWTKFRSRMPQRFETLLLGFAGRSSEKHSSHVALGMKDSIFELAGEHHQIDTLQEHFEFGIPSCRSPFVAGLGPFAIVTAAPSPQTASHGCLVVLHCFR